VILEALILGEDGSHASTAEVPRRVAVAFVAIAFIVFWSSTTFG
jgi:hypothetical protein